MGGMAELPLMLLVALPLIEPFDILIECVYEYGYEYEIGRWGWTIYILRWWAATT
jgi:hypothetical protein